MGGQSQYNIRTSRIIQERFATWKLAQLHHRMIRTAYRWRYQSMKFSWGTDKAGCAEYPLRTLSLYRYWGYHEMEVDCCKTTGSRELWTDKFGLYRYRRTGPPPTSIEDFWGLMLPDWKTNAWRTHT